MMGWGDQGYGMWGMGGLGWLMMLIFWGFIIAGVFWLLRYFTSDRGGNVPPSIVRDPMQILQERYAKGEIDTEEFEERKKILQSS